MNDDFTGSEREWQIYDESVLSRRKIYMCPSALYRRTFLTNLINRLEGHVHLMPSKHAKRKIMW